MTPLLLPGLAASWASEHEDLVVAGASIGLAIVLAALADRALAGYGRRMATAVSGGSLSPVADTRLRFMRRLVSVAILVIGAAVAIAQFSALNELAASVLASSAIAAAVIGFASRQVLANAVAGLMLAITQPLRVGDEVVFEGQEGTVEDVRLNYTFLRTVEGQRIVIPNERLAQGILRNDTILARTVAPVATVAVPAGADVDAALDAVAAALPGVGARVAAVAHDHVALELTGAPGEPGARAASEAAMRLAAVRALQAAGSFREPA